MQEANPVIALIFLAALCASAACVEYDLAMRFGVLFSAFGLFVLLLSALLRAPEGYEDENGFHIVAQPARARHIFALSGFPS
ncbi:MAG TPA: hypothetical protein VE867_04210 [Candidatus Binatia bacterium]|jgi:hypothetical protein|nr:hypothetical protein [Candidatus Binatia bacterium]